MSLLDDVSIVVTPNGYKAGELYAVIPVPTLGSDLVVNGDFATDTDWGKGSGWTISGGTANSDGTSGSNNLYQDNILVVGKQYKIDITVSNYVSGNVQVSAGAVPRDTMTANGTYTFYQTCTPNTTFYIVANSFNGSIDNVSVKEYTSADMDVTRATAATRVDENGLVNYAEVLGSDIIINGDFATNVNGWTDDSGATLTWQPDSTCLVTTTGDNTFAIKPTPNVIESGKSYKISFRYKPNATGLFRVRGGGTVMFSSTTFTVGDWNYVEFIGTSSGANLEFGAAGGGITNFYIDDIVVKEADLDNVPRIDYTGGGCPHILAEPQRTNLITYSEDFTNGIYGKVAAGTGIAPIVTSNYAISPNGTQTADRIQFNLNGGTSGGDISYITTSLSAGTIDASVSIYLKTNDNTTKDITLRLGAGLLDFNVIVTSEWQRFSLSGNTNVDRVQLLLYGNDNSQTADLSVWGLQAEVGSYPTSYIPTSGSTVTRNKDVFTRDGIGSLINSTEGVLFVESAALANDLTWRNISLSDGTAVNRILLQYTVVSNQISIVIIQNNNPEAVLSYISSDITLFTKVAVKYKENDVALWVNGVEVATDTSAVMPTGLNVLAFDNTVNNNDDFYAKIKQLQVYDTALTDNQLIQLTGEAGTHFFKSYTEMAEALTYTIQ